MALQIIEAINTPSTYQFDGDTAELRLYATLPFVTSNGQLIGQGSPINNQSWYLSVTCEVQPENILYVPSFQIDSTTDGQPRLAKYIAALFTEGGAYIGPMPTTNPNGFAIPPPSLMPNPTWGQLAIYNRLPTLLYPPPTFPTRDEMYAAIAAAIGQQDNASSTNKGVTALDVDPVDPTFPIAVGVNSPLIVGAVALASATVKGRTRLSLDPLDALEPIAVGNNDPRTIDISSYDDFADAVATIGSTPTTFNISTNISVVTGVTLPSTLTLRFIQGGGLTITTGQTLTIVGPLIASPSQKIFYNALSGQGTVSFAGTKTPIFEVMWWGALCDGSTDDTAAWQAAIAAVYSCKVGVIRYPAGISQVSAIQFPAYSSAGNEGISVTFEGVGQPPTEAGSFPGSLQVSTRSSIIRSSTASTSGVISWAGTPFQAVSLTLKNCIIRREDDPAGPGVDGTNAFGLYLENAIVDTGRYTTAVVQPTHAGAYGVILPGASNAGSQTIRGDCWIQGYYTGLSAGEHTVQSGHLAISGCIIAMELPAGQLHPCEFLRLHTYNCTTMISVTGSAYINITEWAIEHANNNGVPAWQETVTDIDDAANDAHGKARYNVIKAFVGADSTFTRVGGYNLICDELKFEADKSVFVRNSADIAIPDTTDTTLTFDTVDGNSAVVNVSNPARLQPTQYGMMTVYACVSFAPNATGVRTLEIWKSHMGTDTLISTNQMPNAGGVKSTIMSIAVPASCNDPDDYFFVSVRQTSGAPLNVEASVSPDFSSPRFVIRY